MMKVNEFINMLKKAVASNTVYCKGMFGSPITKDSISEKSRQYPGWYNDERKDNLSDLIGKNYFGFDCIGLIKGILWGWTGDSASEFGGAKYQANGVPDTTELGLINACTCVSSDMATLEAGELLYMTGHCGIYVGNGEVIECTTKWTANVLVSKLHDRSWLRHGRLPWVDYTVVEDKPTVAPGVELRLNDVNLYNSETTSKVTNVVTGTYYIWSDEVINGRIKITNRLDRVGVPNQVTGFVNLTDIGFSKNTEEKETTSNPIELKEGDRITLTSDSVYYNGKAIPGWVKKKTLYFRGIADDKKNYKFSTLKIGPVTGVVDPKYVVKA